METMPSQDGRTIVSLGLFGKLALSVATALLVTFCGWLVFSVQSLLTSAQVTNQQVSAVQLQVQQLNTQMQDVAAVKLKVAELSIQVEQNKQDIKELKQLRGLR